MLLAALYLAAQERPGDLCEFDGFDVKIVLGELRPSEAILVYRTKGEWTCGYVSKRNGAGPEWVRSRDVHLLSIDTNPPAAAWIGTWVNGLSKITIRTSKNAGKLSVEGSGIWKGLGGVVHTGDFEGDAAPMGNRLHLADGGAESCRVDLTLAGRYIVADDNSQCGGMNVRFWGIWRKEAKR